MRAFTFRNGRFVKEQEYDGKLKRATDTQLQAEVGEYNLHRQGAFQQRYRQDL